MNKSTNNQLNVVLEVIEQKEELQGLTELKQFLIHIKESKNEMLDMLDDDFVKDDKFWDRYAYNVSTNGMAITLHINADTFSRMEAFIKSEIENFEL